MQEILLIDNNYFLILILFDFNVFNYSILNLKNTLSNEQKGLKEALLLLGLLYDINASLHY